MSLEAGAINDGWPAVDDSAPSKVNQLSRHHDPVSIRRVRTRQQADKKRLRRLLLQLRRTGAISKRELVPWTSSPTDPLAQALPLAFI